MSNQKRLTETYYKSSIEKIKAFRATQCISGSQEDQDAEIIQAQMEAQLKEQ